MRAPGSRATKCSILSSLSDPPNAHRNDKNRTCDRWLSCGRIWLAQRMRGRCGCACLRQCRKRTCAGSPRRPGKSRRTAMTASPRWRIRTTRFSHWRSPAPRPNASSCTPASQSPSRARRWRSRMSAGISPARPAAVSSSASARRSGRTTSGASRCRGPHRHRACANMCTRCGRSGAAGRPASGSTTRAGTIASR